MFGSMWCLFLFVFLSLREREGDSETESRHIDRKTMQKDEQKVTQNDREWDGEIESPDGCFQFCSWR